MKESKNILRPTVTRNLFYRAPAKKALSMKEPWTFPLYFGTEGDSICSTPALTDRDTSLPWLSAMVGLPWTAHGAVCAFYLNMAKSDHKEGGITFEKAKAAGFAESGNSPRI